MSAKTVDDAMPDEPAKANELGRPPPGVVSRTIFLDRLGVALSRRQVGAGRVAMVSIDLDLFRAIDETLGRDAGDELLTAVVARIKEAIEERDTLTRLGRDHFAVLRETVESEAAAETMAEHLKLSLLNPFSVGGQDHSITASIGIALSGEDVRDAGQLASNAHAAMYQVKKEGGSGLAIFAPPARDEHEGRHSLERSLETAIAERQLRVLYQPVVSLEDQSVFALEALLRWQHPTRGLVSPEDFLSVAEESELIIPMGTWVFREACREAARWTEAVDFASPPALSVNLSAPQIVRPELLKLVSTEIEANRLPPQQVQLEVGAGVLLDDGKRDVLEMLRSSGVRVALDDFGVGYSSVAFLRHLPIDVLKLDRMLIATLGHHASAARAVAAVAGMAGALGLDVVAVGTETAEQAALAREHGCQFGQGYYFARPLPGAGVPGHLQAGAVREAPARTRRLPTWMSRRRDGS